ncbi:preprotein translocase subunit SecY [Candidatus Micrarchaeota archaeon]|nr:preprotein translocase subunit SecY [Candidatus Micrarchaeota archaeon]
MGLIDILHKLAGYLPEIKSPDGSLGTKERLIWTGIALVLYFLMYETTVFGVQHLPSGIDFLQTITASKLGSLLTTGIGPIVLASIFLQLFVGAGILNLNLKDKSDRAKFAEVQKILGILLALVEALIFVVFTKIVPVATIPGVDPTLVLAAVVAQITLGSVFVLFLDELVTKYGLGSGISLFIAAGVSLTVFIGVVQLIFGPAGFVAIMGEGGAEALPNALIELLPFGFTILVFLVVVYAESVKVEIPIAFERVRGMVPKLPLKFFYVSNIPVIFASALIINMQLFSGGLLTGQYWVKGASGVVTGPTDAFKVMSDTHAYDFSRDGVIPLFGYTDSQGRLVDGILYLFTPLSGIGKSTLEHYAELSSASTPIFKIPEWIHAITYILMLGVVSVIFGLFWVETANMDAKSVANQLTGSGIQMPGFRRDPRMLETILNKHIFPLTVMGSLSVGLLAGVADLTGALGTGTGILLTVGILHKMYEQLEQMKTFEMYPSFNKIFGEG